MVVSFNTAFRAYRRITNSLAFYPSLIALGFLALCMLNMAIEYQPWLMSLKQDLDIGLVRNAENARLILGTLVGGIISLMVFSFSMVMVVLTNAAASLSPRVIPGLISSKSHQKTLGFYVGTILYALLLITTIEHDGSDRVPSLGVLIALWLGIACLGFFVHFIRSISQSIQVEHILNNLYHSTLAQFARQAGRATACSAPPHWPDDEHWVAIRAQRNGYYRDLNIAEVNALLCRHQVRMSVLVPPGFFVVVGQPLFKLDRAIDQDLSQPLLDSFDFYIEEYLSSHYSYGCKQISEIAVKALSPGINDPGTALKAIDLLGVLLGERLKLPDLDVAPLSAQPPLLFFRELSLDQLLLQVFGPIRSYGSADASVLSRLLQAYKNLLHQAPNAAHRRVLFQHARSVRDSAERGLDDCREREEINAGVQRINRIVGEESMALMPLNLQVK